MAEMKNTYLDYTFPDGDTVKLTIAFYALYQLKNKNKKAYEDYNRVMVNGIKEELDQLTVLYAAYLCANIEDISSCMSEEEFIIKCGSDHISPRRAVDALVRAKKQ